MLHQYTMYVYNIMVYVTAMLMK